MQIVSPEIPLTIHQNTPFESAKFTFTLEGV